MVARYRDLTTFRISGLSRYPDRAARLGSPRNTGPGRVKPFDPDGADCELAEILRREEKLGARPLCFRTNGSLGQCLPEIEKAARSVMLQPSAPAKEPTAWIHAPSQPLMRSPLSRSQTPAPPRKSQPVFSGPGAPQVALTSRSLSLLRVDKFYFANPFSRRRETN